MKHPPTITNINQLEQERKRITKKEYKIIVIGLIVGLILCFIFNDASTIGIIIIPTIILAELLTLTEKKNFTEAYKHIIIFEIFKKNFGNINFLPNNGINYEIFEKLDVINKPDRYSSNDYISATYKNIPFTSADIHFERKHTDKDGHTHYSTMFQGQWYIFDFNKSFVSDVQIIDSKFLNGTKNKIFKKDFNNIQLEDIEFNKKFNTYAKKDLDAFYLLTPHLIEKIKHLKNNTKGHLIFCFNNKKLHIGVNNRRNSFEPSIFKPINIEEIENKTLKEIQDIIKFIDYLDLDNTLFRKEV